MDPLKWDILLLRAAFAALIALAAAAFQPFGLAPVPALSLGIVLGIALNVLESYIRRARLSTLVGAGTGFALGGIVGLVLIALLPGLPLQPASASFLRWVLALGSVFLGLLLGISKADLVNLSGIPLFNQPEKSRLSFKLLDTSVLIDGRISDIAAAGFLEGELVIPHFVLHELQLVADSPDSAKRNRGRRGLDVVQALQKTPGVQLNLTSQDAPGVREVDRKLIELAKRDGSKIVTNDLNLNKLAQVQGVRVLNINELANALKPVVIPGETMRVFILKEGKEYNQGVAYLDDGTMVVVDNARRLISKTVDIVVTTVHQTTAGKMIFGRYDERQQGNESRSAAAASTSSN